MLLFNYWFFFFKHLSLLGCLLELILVFVIFQACFQNKMTGCASEASEGDLCLYSLLASPFEKTTSTY